MSVRSKDRNAVAEFCLTLGKLYPEATMLECGALMLAARRLKLFRGHPETIRGEVEHDLLEQVAVPWGLSQDGKSVFLVEEVEPEQLRYHVVPAV